jgi:hypothetical protein
MTNLNNQCWRRLGVDEFADIGEDFSDVEQFPDMVSLAAASDGSYKSVDELLSEISGKSEPIPDVMSSVIDSLDQSESSTKPQLPASVKNNFNAIMNTPKLNLNALGGMTQRMMSDKYSDMADKVCDAVYNMVYSSNAIQNGVSANLNLMLGGIYSALTAEAKPYFKSMMDDGSLVDLAKGFSTVGDMRTVAGLDDDSLNSLRLAMSRSALHMLAAVRTFNYRVKSAMSNVGQTEKSVAVGILLDNLQSLKSVASMGSAFVDKTTQSRAAIDSTFEIPEYLLKKMASYNKFTFNYIRFNVSSSDFAQLKDFQSIGYDMFDMISTASQTEILAMTALPLAFLMRRPMFCRKASSLTESDRVGMLECAGSFTDDAGLRGALSACYEIMRLAPYNAFMSLASHDLETVRPIVGMPYDIKSVMDFPSGLLRIFSNMATIKLGDVTGLAKSVYADFSNSSLTKDEIMEFLGMSPNSWAYVKDASSENFTGLFSSANSMSQTMIADLMGNSLTYLTKYVDVRLGADAANDLGALTAEVIFDICSRKTYKDLSKFSTLAGISVCQTILDYGDDRKNLTDSQLKAMALDTGTHWTVLKTLCLIEMSSLQKIVAVNSLNAMRSLSKYDMKSLRDASSHLISFDYLLSIPASMLSTVIGLIRPPASESVPVKFNARLVGNDLIGLKEATFLKIGQLKAMSTESLTSLVAILRYEDPRWSRISSIKTAEEVEAILGMASVKNNPYENVYSFFSIIDKVDMAYLAGVSDETYSKLKNTTSEQFAALGAFSGMSAAKTLLSVFSTKAAFDSIMGVVCGIDMNAMKAIGKLGPDGLYELVEASNPALGLPAATRADMVSVFSVKRLKLLNNVFRLRSYAGMTKAAATHQGLGSILKILGCVDSNNKKGAIPSEILKFAASLTYDQFMAVDSGALNGVLDGGVYDLLIDSAAAGVVKNLKPHELLTLSSADAGILSAVDMASAASDSIPPEMFQRDIFIKNFDVFSKISANSAITSEMLCGLSAAYVGNASVKSLLSSSNAVLREIMTAITDDLFVNLSKLSKSNAAAMTASQNSDVVLAAKSVFGVDGRSTYIGASFNMATQSITKSVKSIMQSASSLTTVARNSAVSANGTLAPDSAASASDGTNNSADAAARRAKLMDTSRYSALDENYNDICSVSDNFNDSAVGVQYSTIPGMDDALADKLMDTAKLAAVDYGLLTAGLNAALLSFLHFILDNSTKFGFGMLKTDSALMAAVAGKTRITFTEADMSDSSVNVGFLKQYPESVIFDKKAMLSKILLANGVDDVSGDVDICGNASTLSGNMILVNALFKSLDRSFSLSMDVVRMLVDAAMAENRHIQIPKEVVDEVVSDSRRRTKDRFETAVARGSAVR